MFEMFDKEKPTFKSFYILFFVILGIIYIGWIFEGTNDALTILPIGTLLFAIIYVIYFIPYLVCNYKRNTNETTIFFLNLLLGWTIIGWVGALLITLLKGVPIINTDKNSTKKDADSLEILKRNFVSGKITDAEYKKKKRILKE